MLFPPHRPHDGGEALEVGFLHPEVMALEEGQHRCLDLAERIDRVGPHAALGSLGPQPAGTEERDESFEHISMILMLVDVEDGMELPATGTPRIEIAVHR